MHFPTRSLRLGWLFALLAGAALTLTLPLPARAVTPVELDSVVTDTTNSLGGRDIQAVEEASAELKEKTGVSLYLVVVDRFEDPADGFEWANASVERSQLGAKDVVLYIGEDVYEYGLSIDHTLNISDTDRRNITNKIRDEITEGRYADAAVEVAEYLDRAIRKEEIAAEEAAAINTALGVGAVGTATVGGTMYVVGKRRKNKRTAAAAARRAAEFKERSDNAGIELVRMDNLIRSAEEEVQFATAQFGGEVTADYGSAVQAAKQRAQDAFALQGKLFDHIPDTEQEQDSWLGEIEAITQTTARELSEHQQRFAQLQQRQSQVPQLVAALNDRIPALRSRHDELTNWLTSVKPQLDAESIAPIGADMEQSDRMLQLAALETENAQQGWDAGDRGAAIVDVTDAESAITQAADLLDSLDAARQQIIDAPAAIASKTRDVTQLLLQLEQLHRTDPSVIDAGEQSAISKARAELTATEQLGGVYRNPITTTSRLITVESTLQSILQESMDEKTRLDHARAALVGEISDARAEVAVVERYINSHRGGLSSAPRARLAQAVSQLNRAEAMHSDNPLQALEHAREAARLARKARSDAEDEMTRYDAANYWSGGVSYGGSWSRYGGNRRYSRNSSGSTVGDAIIGGIIGGLLSGGGSSHRSSSGGWSSGGGSFRGGGFGGGGGGWSSGGGFR